MAEEGTFTTNAEVLRKVGANASSTSSAEDYTNQFIREAESYINIASRKNWTDAYSELNDDVKYILKEAASNLAAIYVIQYDMSGYSSRIEAEDMINILFARFVQCMDILTDLGAIKFMTTA